MNEQATHNDKMTMTRFTEMMHNVSGALMLGGQTLISAFFVIVILILVLAVEIQRVAHGILLFEQSTNLSYLGAFVLVMMLLTLEFVIHYVESKTGYHQQQKSHFSLRILWRWLKYVSGYENTDNGVTWNERLKSPAHSIKSYSRLLTVTILALALGGSMSETLASVSGNWMTGLQTIALESSLLEIVEWSGGLLFALALVIGAQRLTAYVAQRASETLAQSSQDEYVDSEININPLENHQDLLDTQPSPALTAYDDSYLLQEPEEPEEPETFSSECLISECDWHGQDYSEERYARQALKMHMKKAHDTDIDEVEA